MNLNFHFLRLAFDKTHHVGKIVICTLKVYFYTLAAGEFLLKNLWVYCTNDKFIIVHKRLRLCLLIIREATLNECCSTLKDVCFTQEKY